LYKVGPVYDWEGGFLSNSGGYIAIKNSLGVVVDSVAYDDEGYWSTAADGNGASLEIIDVNKDNNDYSNWRASKTPLNVKVGSVDVFCSPSSLPLINPTKEISKEADFIVYPNPVSGNEIYFSRELRGYLADAMGRILKRFDKVTQVDVSGLPTGLYFVATDSGIKKVLIQK
jgi:hypothetical protein